MSPTELLKSEKGRWAIAIVYMVLTTTILVLKELVIPRMQDGRTFQQAIAMVEMRVSRIENVLERIDSMEAGAAQRTEAIGTLKMTVDRIEKKIDEHMARDRK